MTDKSTAPLDPQLFAKALQVESESEEPITEDQMMDSAAKLMQESADPLISEVGRKMIAKESLHTLADDKDFGPQLQTMAEETSNDFSDFAADQIFTINAELKDLFDLDGEDDTPNKH